MLDFITQISYEPLPPSEHPELLDYVPEGRLVQLSSAAHGYKTRKSTALAAHTSKTLEVGILNETRISGEAKKESALVEMRTLRATVETLRAEQEVSCCIKHTTSSITLTS